jgi:hypothetical protein
VVGVSNPWTEFQYRGQAVRANLDKDPWEIMSSERQLDWRWILIAPELAPRPVVLEGLDGLDSLADDIDLTHHLISDQLREALSNELTMEEASADAAPDAELEQKLIAEHQALQRDYVKLAEDAQGIDPNSSAAFALAQQEGVIGSLTLYDDRPPPPPKPPIPVAPLPSYLSNLATVAGANWEATSCKWDGLSVLYEQASPRTNGGLKPGRCLILLAFGTYTLDLRYIDTKKLTTVGSPSGPIPPRFTVRAALTTN